MTHAMYYGKVKFPLSTEKKKKKNSIFPKKKVRHLETFKKEILLVR